MIKLTIAQIAAVKTALSFSEHGVYMPYATAARTFEACERKGAMVYRSVDNGYKRNGYEVTEAGRLAAK